MLKLSLVQFQEILTRQPVKQAGDLGHNIYHSTFEAIIDEPICKGSTKSIRIREGITFLKLTLTFFQDTELEMMSTQPQVGFCFCLKGLTTAYVHDISDNPEAKFSVHLHDRTSYIYANRSSKGHQHFWANKTLQAVYIHFSYDSFRELMGDSLEQLPNDFIDALNSLSDSFYFFTQLSQSVLTLCHSLLTNPFKGKSSQFYTEAKVIELIAHQIDLLSKQDSKHTPVIAQPLNKSELEKIEVCYQELQQNLDNPPSLLELAKKGGLSVYRLKNGFLQKYGDTPYRVLTELRMHKAKELLEKGGYNVSEVALEVGYNSLGTFSNTFFQKFGFRPSTYKK